jgi:hypothetical protein
MSSDNPNDPFEGFDWSKQDGFNPQSSSTPKENSGQQMPPPPPLPELQPDNLSPSAPAPGTYYSNGQEPLTTTGRLAGTLTAFMVLQWITFGFGVFGFCASIPSIALNGFAATDSVGGGPTYVIYFLFSTATGVVATVFAFLSANAIVKRKKVGIKYGWIELSISWAALIIGTAFSFLFSLDMFLGEDRVAISLASSAIGLGCGIIFPAAKTILLSLPSTKESANRDLS